MRLPNFVLFLLIGPSAHIYLTNGKAISAEWFRLVRIKLRHRIFRDAKSALAFLRRVLTGVDLSLNRYLNQTDRLVEFALREVS